MLTMQSGHISDRVSVHFLLKHSQLVGLSLQRELLELALVGLVSCLTTPPWSSVKHKRNHY